jgi:hypothetical protein
LNLGSHRMEEINAEREIGFMVLLLLIMQKTEKID